MLMCWGGWSRCWGEAGEPQGPAPEDLLGGMEFEFYSKRHLRVRSRSDLSRGAVFKVRMVTA